MVRLWPKRVRQRKDAGKKREITCRWTGRARTNQAADVRLADPIGWMRAAAGCDWGGKWDPAGDGTLKDA